MASLSNHDRRFNSSVCCCFGKETVKMKEHIFLVVLWKGDASSTLDLKQQLAGMYM